jgi:hypothetical protein
MAPGELDALLLDRWQAARQAAPPYPRLPSRLLPSQTANPPCSLCPVPRGYPPPRQPRGWPGGSVGVNADGYGEVLGVMEGAKEDAES